MDPEPNYAFTFDSETEPADSNAKRSHRKYKSQEYKSSQYIYYDQFSYYCSWIS